jgi:flavin reductase (DIM6/NTAB) family NADH-FMN oxidoreductase RutF
MGDRVDSIGPPGVEIFSTCPQLPILRDAVAALECRTTTRLPRGHHTILIGEAISIRLQVGTPAEFYDRRFWTWGTWGTW